MFFSKLNHYFVSPILSKPRFRFIVAVAVDYSNVKYVHEPSSGLPSDHYNFMYENVHKIKHT